MSREEALRHLQHAMDYALWCARRIDELAKPIDMVLHCPACGLQHIDAPGMNSEFDNHTWTNPPHRSHLCHGCGHIWRPADVPTNGVQAITTRGKNDSPIVERDNFGRTAEMIRFQNDLDAGDDE